MYDELCYLPATQLVTLLRDRRVSARELLDAHLDRIERVNPRINAIVTLDVEGARRMAFDADQQLVHGSPIGPLHGLPVAHKDTHLTAGLRTTSGSPLNADFVPAADELVVARLAQAGAIRIGKTNVPEFGAGSHTFNPIFGVTRNPYRTDRTAGGSSGGAAAALAAGLVPIAEGSDLGGSLRNPAAFCNVVGLRPSLGRVPRHPVHLGWSALAVQGPLGRTVADVALVLSVLAKPDERVPRSSPHPEATFTNVCTDAVRGLRVAWTPDLGGTIPVDAGVRDVLACVPEVVPQLGATVTLACPDLTGADEVFNVLRAWQFAVELGDVVRRHPDQVKATVRWDVERGAELSATDIGRAELLRTRLHERVIEFFSRYDVLLAPTTQVLPFPVETEYPAEVDGVAQENYLAWMRSCSLITATGCPALSVPAGFSPDGSPVGLQVVGPPGADRRVLEFGMAWEATTQHGLRRPHVENIRTARAQHGGALGCKGPDRCP